MVEKSIKFFSKNPFVSGKRRQQRNSAEARRRLNEKTSGLPSGLLKIILSFRLCFKHRDFAITERETKLLIIFNRNVVYTPHTK
jgi:hypothetical protein